MRLIHTADWHLGQHLHGVAREYEHRRFLDWLLEQLQTRAVDALLVCGDVFDSANPSAAAQEMFFAFLAESKRRCPHLDIIVISGNHDSPARLQAPAALLHAMRIYIIGNPREDNAVPLHNADGEIAAWCAALPFLRPGDLPVLNGETRDPLVEGVRIRYAEALEQVQRCCHNGEALLATGHCYMSGTALSELSERKILGGNQHALPVDIFASEFTYTALGHLHRAQQVGERERVRYSGSPIPLALSEDSYPHQVVQIDIEEGGAFHTEALRVPRFVEVLRIPRDAPATLEEVLDRLAELELPQDLPAEQKPLLEARVTLDRPHPDLRLEIEKALQHKAVRLVKISPVYAGGGDALADLEKAPELRNLLPEEVLSALHRQRYGTPPDDALMADFHELLDALPL